MAKITEILNIEENRQENGTQNIIHLFKEGSFYRAYNWSAFLIVRFTYTDDAREETKDRKPLSVTKKRIKEGDNDFVFVGFPLKSVDKFIPHRIEFAPQNDTQIDITIDLGETDDEQLLSDYESWKNGIKISEKKPVELQGHGDSVSISPRSISAIMSSVLSYPLERKTPIENMEFISQLKSELSLLF